MRKYLKILLLCVFLIGLTALPAMAVDLTNVNGNSFGTASTGNSYRIALEAYSNAAGVSTIADDGTHKGQIRVWITQPLTAGDTVNLKIDPANVNAKFQATPDFKYGLCINTSVVGGVCQPGGIIGSVPTAGVVTDNLAFGIATGITIGTPGNPTNLYVVQWNDKTGTGIINQLDAGEQVLMGAGLSVNSGLGASCTSTPLIKIVFTTPHEATVTPQILAFITPQFSVATKPRSDTFDAELDTDFDFLQFIMPSGTYVQNIWEIYNCDPDSGIACSSAAQALFTIANNVNAMWIAFVNGTPTGTITFDVVSSTAEPCVYAIKYPSDGPYCSSSDNITWHCNSGVVDLTGYYGIENELWFSESYGSCNPTIWTIANSAVLPANTYCIDPINGQIGVWWGGVEVLVPFVKVGSGYDTTIKLFNRYKKDAKLYVKTFKGDSNSIIIAKDPLTSCTKPAGDATGCDVIAADSSIVIRGADIAAFCPTCNMENGIPVKFLVRVPTQIGTTTSAGTWTGTYGGGTNGGTSAATLTYKNPKDPYVEGIVVQQIPGGQQRTVPLEFKAFKQGNYNQ